MLALPGRVEGVMATLALASRPCKDGIDNSINLCKTESVNGRESTRHFGIVLNIQAIFCLDNRIRDAFAHVLHARHAGRVRFVHNGAPPH